MKIIHEYPPNYDMILREFPKASLDGIIFAYSPDIYSPTRMDVDLAIIEHEKVHIDRQKLVGVDFWWDQYVSSVDFRYYEELLAHAAEYACMIRGKKSQKKRDSILITIAKKLIHPVYKHNKSLTTAITDILTTYKRSKYEL
jgi:hypothetical protein